MPDMCVEDYLLNFFETLFFPRLGIQSLDATLTKLGNLRILNLSYNKITKLQNLPPNLKELYLTGNQISEISSSMRLPSLIHLGLAYNKLQDDQVEHIVTNFPGLFCLDLSFNDLTNLTHIVQQLQTLPDLKMLYLLGNPLHLTPKYRDIIKQRFQKLKILDNIPTLNESDSPKKRGKKLAIDPNMNELIEIKEEMTLDL